VTTARHLESAAARFADTVHADVSAQVQLAWALERDRLYEELGELHARVDNLQKALNHYVPYLREAERLHSVRAEP